jgi:two-component system, chemotaxis family, protein-glutamate methylesterase/glutaminase
VTLKVLVVDDSILFRRVISQALASVPDVEVVGSVATGKLALQRIQEFRPDLMTLDVEMPGMDGLAVLDSLRQGGNEIAVIVVSSVTRHGAKVTMRALEKGAFDFITKPDTENAEQSRALLTAELAPRLRALAGRLAVRRILRSETKISRAAPGMKTEIPPASPPLLSGVTERMNRISNATRPEMVLIGVSTGGPNALSVVLPEIPADIGVPIFVVQHMPPVFTQSLAENLSARCSISVREAAQGSIAVPGTAYIAPGGKQMRLAPGPDGRKVIQISDDPPENNCKPSVDYLFRSASINFSGKSMAVILTGMGSDGTIGLKLLKRHGCYVIAQNEATSVVYGMPKAAVDAKVVDDVLPLDEIAKRITAVIRGWFA